VEELHDVRQTGIHTAEPLVLDPISFEVENDVTKFKKYKSPGIGQIPAELFQAECKILRPEIRKVIRKTCQFTRRTMKLAAVIIDEYH
jgi:hypothetical protein